MGTDGKLHFTNSAGADTVLNFSSGKKIISCGTIAFNVRSTQTLNISTVLTNNGVSVNSVTKSNIFFQPVGTGTNKASGIGTDAGTWGFDYSYSNGVVSATVGDVAYEAAFRINMRVYVVI